VNAPQNLDVRRAKRILLIQSATTLVVAAGAVLFGWLAGLSALFGGMIATVANALFAVWVFGRYRAQDPGNLAFRFYGAELFKLLFIALAFALVFVWLKPVSLVALFGAFLLVQVLPPMLAHKAG
jgi:ATP synthase protein I